MSKQVIECIKDYPRVGGSIKKGTILTEDPQATKESFDATVFVSKEGGICNFNNSEIFFSPDFKKSFKLLRSNK